MKRLKIIYPLLILCLISAGSSHGQAAKEKVTKYFKILKLGAPKGDTIYGSIYANENYGLSILSTGNVTAAYQAGSPRSEAELGSGIVNNKVDGKPVYIVLLINKHPRRDDSLFRIREGDLIQLPVEVKAVAEPGIFRKIDLLGIYFESHKGEFMHTSDVLLNRDDKAFEDSMFRAYIADMRDAASKLGDSVGPEYQVPIQKGRFKGMNLLQVMKESKPEDVHRFLLYVLDFYRGYYGKEMIFQNYFLGWARDGAEMSGREMLDSLILYAGKPILYDRFIAEHKKSILETNAWYTWIRYAKDLADNDRNKEAFALFDNMAPAFRVLGEPVAAATYLIVKAEALQNMKQYPRAIRLCDSAMAAIRNVTEPDHIYYQANYKKAICLVSLREKEKALAVSDQLLQYLAADTTIRDSVTIKFIQGRIHKEKGRVYKAFEQYPQALEEFRLATDLFKSITGNAARAQETDVLSSIAKIYELQNRNPEAEKTYKELLQTYLGQGDLGEAYKTISNIAYSRSKQGNYTKALPNYNIVVNYYKAVKNWELAGYNLSQVGQCYWNLGMYDSAIDAHNRALDLQYQGNNNEYRGYAWNKLGNLYSLSGNLDRSTFAFDSALYYARKDKDTGSYIDYLSDKGDAYTSVEDFRRATDLYREAVQLARNLRNKGTLMNALYKWGFAVKGKDSATARKNFQESLKLADELGDKEKQIYSTLNLGLLQSRQNKYAAADGLFRRALSVAQKDQNPYNLAECYRVMGDAAEKRMNYDSAISLYNTCYQLYDSARDVQKLATISRSLGLVCINRLQYELARSWFEKSLVFADSGHNNLEKANSYSGRSYLYLLKGDNKNAKQDLDSIEQISRNTQNKYLQAGLYIDLGNYYSRLFELGTSIDYYNKADTIYTGLGDIESRLTCLNNIGNLYLSQRDYDKALFYFLQAIALDKKLGVTTSLSLLLKLNASESWYNKKEYAKALALANECEQIALRTGAERRRVSASELKGMIAFKKKDYAAARSLMLDVIRTRENLQDSLGATTAQLYLCRIAKEEKKYDEALRFALKAEDWTERAEDENALWEILYEKGNIFLLQEQYDSAISNYKRAVDIVIRLTSKMIGTEEEKNKLKSEETRTDLFNQLIAACFAGKKVDEAVYYTNLANLQGIKEKTQETGSSGTPEQLAAEAEKKNELLQRKNTAKETIEKEKSKPAAQQNKELLSSMTQIVKTAENEYDNFIDDLATKNADIKTSFAEAVNPNKFSNYKKNIPDSLACLLYVVNQKNLYIFTVTNKETLAFKVVLDFNIDTSINTLQRALHRPQSDFQSGPLQERGTKTQSRDTKKPVDYSFFCRQLYNVLIKPVADVIRDKKTLCIIPTGRLNLVPFQVLAYKGDTSNHYLIEDYELFYTSQMEVFIDTATIRKSFDHFAAFGNPDKSLDYSEVEINNLREIFSKAEYYIQDSATEIQARESLSKDKYVHFATHGILDYNDFRNSYLVFAGNNAKDPLQDGKLTIREIKSLNIENCELVTLSACETGVNKEISKGWYISPANSFLVKGVRSVIASLWKVNDMATSILMTEFYKNLQTMGKAAALRKAQISLSQQYPFQHPYYWSPFLLYGDWR